MKSKCTSTDVARAAGVSQATVSMVLNKKYNVSFSKEVIDRVERAARELGYEIPKKRNHKDSRAVKLIVAFCPTLTNPYYVMLLQGIETIAKENGYGVFVCNTQRELHLEEQYLKMMKRIQPQGIIYTCNPSASFSGFVEELAKEIPLVVISNREMTVDVDAISQDNTKVGRLMARHLLELGHRDVAFIAPPLTKRQQQRLRRVEGFVNEFASQGLKEQVIIKAADDSLDKMQPKVDSEYKMGYNLTKELLQEKKSFTAIAGLNDMIALGAIDALLEEKYKVPRDISVIGCDNIFYTQLRRVSLTTIEHFVPLKGRDACEIVLKKINSAGNPYSEVEPTSLYRIEYAPKLIVRRSTDYVKREKNGKKETT